MTHQQTEGPSLVTPEEAELVGLSGRRDGYLPADPTEETVVPDKKANVKNEEQYEALKEKGMSKERAARIANSPDASKKGGENSKKGASRSSSKQGGTTAQKKAAGRKGGEATARKRSS